MICFANPAEDIVEEWPEDCFTIPFQELFAKNTILKEADDKDCFTNPAEDIVEEWPDAAETISYLICNNKLTDKHDCASFRYFRINLKLINYLYL